MENVSIKKKSDDISFEQIQELLSRAHKSNQEKGIIYATASQTVEKLKEKIGEDGICFVAVVDGELAGTATVSFRTLNYWYHNGEVAIIKLVGVDPAFKGKKISSKLIEACLKEAEAKGKKIVVSDSAEQNVIIKSLLYKHGFLKVDYGIYAANNFYTSVYAYWFDKCPYSTIYRNFKYLLKKIRIRFLYKPKKIKRFSFLKY